MNTFRPFIPMMAALFLLPAFSDAQGNANNNGASGSAFLNIGVGARAMGMGGAAAAIVDDATALYWNPSRITMIPSIRIASEYTQWVAEMDHGFFGAVIPLTDQITIGGSVIYLSSGDIEITTIEMPRGTGELYSTSDIALGATLGYRVTTDLSVGATLKYVRNDLYSLSASGIAFDFGATFDTRFHGMQLAFQANNIGASRAYSGRALDFYYAPPYPGAEPIRANYSNVPFLLPLSYHAAVAVEAFEFIGERTEGQTLMVAADLVQPYTGPEHLHLGAEYSYEDRLFARTGYSFNTDEFGFNAGFGGRVTIGSYMVEINYAYATLQRFDGVHRYGIGFTL